MAAPAPARTRGGGPALSPAPSVASGPAPSVASARAPSVAFAHAFVRARALALALSLSLSFAVALVLPGGAARATEGAEYRTPRAGEAVDARILGREVHVPARDLHTVLALELGFASVIPRTGGIPVIPFGALFVFYRPDEDRFIEAIVAGIQNDIYIAWSPPKAGSFEFVTTFLSSTIPAAQSEIVNGRDLSLIEIVQGSVRVGAGVGYRRSTGDSPENMWAVSALIEPGYLYFDKGDKTSAFFIDPLDTVELRARVQLRYDAFQRNLLAMIHSGFGFGAQAMFGYRTSWQDWGLGGAQDGADGAQWGLVRGYIQGAMGVPFVRSERHRLVGSLHGGIGWDLDRFSAPRIGGGIEADQFRAVQRPLLPGAALGEFYPTDYAILLAEYRYELFFFSYLGLRASVSHLGPNAEQQPLGSPRSPWLTSIGGRWTTGFFFQTRMRIDYNYNFDVIRDGRPGGHEVVFDISREFF